MPTGTRVSDCVQDVMKQGHSKESAIRICQKSTGLAYATGKPPKGKKRSHNPGYRPSSEYE